MNAPLSLQLAVNSPPKTSIKTSGATVVMTAIVKVMVLPPGQAPVQLSSMTMVPDPHPSHILINWSKTSANISYSTERNNQLSRFNWLMCINNQFEDLKKAAIHSSRKNIIKIFFSFQLIWRNIAVGQWGLVHPSGLDLTCTFMLHSIIIRVLFHWYMYSIIYLYPFKVMCFLLSAGNKI